VWIKKHLEIFENEFLQLLSEDEKDNLGRMYRLVKRIPDGLTKLCSLLGHRIETEGLSTIERGVNAAHSVPKAFLTMTLKEHDKYVAFFFLMIRKTVLGFRKKVAFVGTIYR
jgi:cullin 1